MGEAILSGRIVFEEELTKMARFGWFLRAEERAVFDDLLAQCRLYASAAGVMASSIKEAPLLLDDLRTAQEACGTRETRQGSLLIATLREMLQEANRPTPNLILEFASDKPRLRETEDRILTVVKRHLNLNASSPIPQPEQVGLFPGERRAAIFTYKWCLPLRERVEENTIRTLETQLSGLEVHRVYFEDSA